MSVFDLIKDQLGKTVPFARHTGVAIEEVGEGTARALLPESDETLNHLGSRHAGALFTLGEAASGAALAGGFAERILELQLIAGGAEIAYAKVAKGPIVAEARIGGELAELTKQLADAGKVQFPVLATLSDRDGVAVATMKVEWHVRERRS